jgi:predicted RNase H-like nuclease (RuvC/YqgF family)|tara:strand:+ start:2126 stop:2401 length:276 start_codon:yes stop_codon:yes gene_type:complete
VQEGFVVLEEAVDQAIDQLSTMSERIGLIEAKNTELAKLVERFTGDELEADRIVTQVRELEAENTELRDRLVRGREGVDRLLTKIQFLENH